jgi:hypothetical protein
MGAVAARVALAGLAVKARRSLPVLAGTVPPVAVVGAVALGVWRGRAAAAATWAPAATAARAATGETEATLKSATVVLGVPVASVAWAVRAAAAAATAMAVEAALVVMAAAGPLGY